MFLFLGLTGRHWQKINGAFKSSPKSVHSLRTHSPETELLYPYATPWQEGLWRHSSLHIWVMKTCDRHLFRLRRPWVHPRTMIYFSCFSHTCSSEGTEWEFNILQMNLLTLSHCGCKSTVFFCQCQPKVKKSNPQRHGLCLRVLT
jgi:hypothetical protein